MLILLIGPKGSGKSHIGRILEAHLGVHFFHVEPLWMEYYAACGNTGREPRIGEGIERVHPAVSTALEKYRDVCVETTGASRDILQDLIRRGGRVKTILVKVSAPVSLCLERIVSRNRENQIPMDEDSIRRIYDLGRDLDLPFDLVLENVALSSEDILRSFSEVLRREK